MGRMNDELEVTWKEAIVDYSTYFKRTDLEHLRKIIKILVRIASVPAKIRTQRIQKTSLETATLNFWLN
jgi:hypothetical protein